VLHPDVVLRTDRGAVPGGRAELRGVRDVSGQMATFQRAASSYATRPALVNGAAGVVALADGRPTSVLSFTITNGVIAAIDILADPERLARLDVTVLEG
jgi:RNA polymerase sigma-70 factor, ECF subfamily